MKSAAFRKACVWLRILTLLAGPISSAENLAVPPALKVEVKVPTSWNLLPSDRFPELFAASLGDALSREGLTVPITALRSVEDPTKATYVLKVEITDWKMANAGDIACTFTASLKTPVDERRLGEYSRMRWAPGVIYSNSNHAYYPTQLDGLRALARDLDRSELLHEPPTLHFASMNR